MIDLCITNVPKMDLRSPSIGVAIINAAAKNAGLSSIAVDLNIKLWRKFVSLELGNYWSYSDETFIDRKKFLENREIIYPLFKEVIVSVIPPAKVIGISIFSAFNYVTLELVLEIIRELHPTSKIVLGGPGISIRNRLECEQHFRRFKKLKLYDDFLYGNSLSTVVEYINETIDPSMLNDFVEDPRGASFADFFPDYRDFNFADYPKKHLEVNADGPGPNNWLYITGSRGCVRSCTFCDVKTVFGNYKTRTGKNIAEEMIHQYQVNGVDKFRFTDSLLNGNLKVLRELCEKLVTFPKKLLWHGQYICRDKSQQNPEFYDLMKSAGLDLISIGIESGSEQVRFHMGKRFNNASLYYTLDQCLRVGIKIVPLMMVGYPTETEEDFLETLNFLDNLKKYEDILVDLNLNNPTRILPGSPLGDHLEMYNISHTGMTHDYDFTANWECGENTYKVRIERFFRFLNSINKNDFKRSYAAGDVNHYKNEYLKLPDPDLKIIELIEKVIHGTYYTN